MTKQHAVGLILAVLAFVAGPASAAGVQPVQPTPLTESGQKLQERYEGMLKALRAEIVAALPAIDAQKKNAFLEACKAAKAAPDKAQEKTMPAAAALNLAPLLASDRLDAKLVKCVVLLSATPRGLAEFAQQGTEQAALVDKLLADPELMKQMLVADGAVDGKYGRAMEIYAAIQKASAKARDGVLQRLALAISLEHAVPLKQDNPAAKPEAPANVDPVKRYLDCEKAYLAGELDPAFKDLTAWELRFVVDGEEPDETHTWGRVMLRNFRPDIVTNPVYNWRYVQAVATDVKYGSGDVKYDRPELQQYQNIIMNGGVCGRRAFFGRFILRSFGIPVTARPQSGHAALVHWTPKGWVPCLGAGWGGGWTKTIYKSDLDFLASTQARAQKEAFLQVKRAQWIGGVMGETPVYGLRADVPGFWYGVALHTQREVIDKAKVQALAAVGTELGESNATKEMAASHAATTADADARITVDPAGVVRIPAAAYGKPAGKTADVIPMKSFGGGMQVCLPRFGIEGLTIIRGGTWKTERTACSSGGRGLSGGYGAYEDWGFRVAMTPAGANPPASLTLDLGSGVTLDLVYIKPGTFVMGGESTTDGRFNCVEVPKHEVRITKGFYLGKYEVTQAQYQSIMGANPSKSAKDPNGPVDCVPEGSATDFCDKLADKTGQAVRLPTEAEWEYACRAGTTTKTFVGDDPAQLGEYGWFKDNADGKSHPVGQKKPNAWGLYDMYGNVCERVADRYAKDYYAKSPKDDPTGPSQGVKSRFEYTINVPRAGTYTLTARVVANNYNQRLNVAVNGAQPELTMPLPFTCGQWKDSEPVKLVLKAGANTLSFSRTDPPQAGIAIKSLALAAAK